VGVWHSEWQPRISLGLLGKQSRLANPFGVYVFSHPRKKTVDKFAESDCGSLVRLHFCCVLYLRALAGSRPEVHHRVPNNNLGSFSKR
jgi:hypothetical protein